MRRLTIGIVITFVLWLTVAFLPGHVGATRQYCPGSNFWIPENIPTGWQLGNYTTPQTTVILSWTAYPRTIQTYGAIIPISVCESADPSDMPNLLHLEAQPIYTYNQTYLPAPTPTIIKPYPSVELTGDDWLILDRQAGLQNAQLMSSWDYGNGVVDWAMQPGNYLIYLPSPYRDYQGRYQGDNPHYPFSPPAYSWVWISIQGVF